MTAPPENPTVLDTTVLSNFAQVDHVALLVALPRVVTTSAVETELQAGSETHPYLEGALAALDEEIPVVAPSERATELEAQLLETLDPGEAQSLAVAAVTDGTIVTDDGDGRSTATERGVDLTGSIGVLVRAVEADELSVTRADTYLKTWIDQAGFRSPARDFAVFLDE